MTKLITCTSCNGPEIEHKKGDDFLLVFEVLTEDDEDPFDASLVDLTWTISNGSGVLVTMMGADLTVEDNYIQFNKDKSFFDAFNYMSAYTHKLYENNTGTTIYEGKFQLI